MWKLSKLEIQGFKSFADQAELEFPEGITAVVGPNGCGKSNISDAILWVLGEQSTRALRARRMKDVIFQGSADRKATGLAEVTLHLSNGLGADGAGPDGAGANGAGAADAGASGAGGTAMEGNGTGSDDVISAGGVRIDASGEVEIVASDASSTAGEVGEPGEIPPDGADPEDRHAPAGGNGARPESHGTGANGAGEFTITRRLYRSGDSEYLMDGDICRLRDIRDRLAGTGLGQRACFTIGQGQIDQILSASPTERRAPLEEAAGITLYRHRRHLTQLKLEATAQDLARVDDICEEVARQMRSLKRQAGRARRYKKLRDRQRLLERTWLEAAWAEAREQLEHAAAGASGARAAEESARETLETAGEALGRARKELQETRSAEQERRQGLYQLQLRHERLRSDASRHEDRLEYAEERLEELRRRLGELAERIEEAGSLHERRQEAAREAEAAAAEARGVLAEAEEKLEAARRRAAGRIRAETLVDEEPGKPLAAHLELEERDHAALSLALGELLEVPVYGEPDLDGWLDDVLEGATAARALWDAGRGEATSPPPADDRIAGVLRERVRARTATGKAVLNRLLKDTWLVASAADVPRLAREHPGHAFVDLSGRCWACGPEVRARGRQAELADLAGSEEESSAGEEREARTPTTPEELACREVRDRAATALRAAEAQARAAEQEVAVAAAARRRLGVEKDRAEAEVESLQEAARTSREKAREARREAEEAARRSEEMEAELEEGASDDRAAAARVEGLELARSDARSRVEAAHDERSGWEVRSAEARTNCRHLEEQIRERLGMEPGELTSARAGDRREKGEDDEKGGKAEKSADAEKGAGAEKSGKAAKADRVPSDLRAVRAEIQQVQDKLERLGPVNLVAYEELQEQEERHADLDAQRSDLRQAMDNLGAAIERIDVDCETRFEEAFEAINGYLNRIFRQLFGGGRAGMRLENPEEPLESGIEIHAQPPGKKLQNIRLLSGGERSLVALALLFAIFEYQPAAFCILDEADAALDEHNVDRFLRALHRLEERTQFILITHNKRTMEVADLLYGVTMQESGVSKLVSVQLN